MDPTDPKQGTLELRAHDLPPFWDGYAVSWGGWHALDAFICGRGKEPCCEACGSRRQAILNTGTVARLQDMTHADINADRDRQKTARRLRAARTPRALKRLTAFRCPDCQADQVLDSETDEMWTLDDSDYGDNGTNAPT